MSLKVIVQIPAFNEEGTIADVVRAIPREIPGAGRVEILVVDDGSADRTAEVAREAGADHVVRHTRNRGLAAAFQTGIDRALELGADAIVNTDADGQYPGSQIAALLAPVLRAEADIVIGDRRIAAQKRLSWSHRLLQRLGSAVVRRISGSSVPDAPSGFRAISRDAALRLEVLTTYTYTLETIIQAGMKGLRLASVPIDVNPPTRPSRLMRSQGEYVLRSLGTILQLYVLYRPFKTFFMIAFPFLALGAGLWIRYLVLMLQGEAGRGAHVQSVVAGAALIIISIVLGSLGILGNLLARNRALAERTLHYSRRALFSRPPERR